MRAVAAAALVVAMGAGSASAATIISNLNGNDGGATTLVGSLNRSKAQGFTMPATGTYRLDSAVVRLDIGNTSMTIAAGLYGSSSGTPSGPALASFTVPAFAVTGIQNYTLTPTSTFLLQPSTTYFLVAYGTSTGSSTNYIDWMANSPSTTPTGTATFAGAYGDNTGAVTVPPTTSSTTANSFAINATAVPEPGAFATTVVLVLGAGVLRRVRGNRSNSVA